MASPVHSSCRPTLGNECTKLLHLKSKSVRQNGSGHSTIVTSTELANTYGFALSAAARHVKSNYLKRNRGLSLRMRRSKMSLAKAVVGSTQPASATLFGFGWAQDKKVRRVIG